MIFVVITAMMLITAFITDVTKQQIPNMLTAGGWLLGMILHTGLSGWSGLKEALIGSAIGLAPMFLLFVLRAVGAGDVKLFAALGALNGGLFVMQSIMYSLWYAAVVAGLILLWRKQLKASVIRIYHVLLHLLALKNTMYWKAYSTSGHHLRFPMMWAVLPAAITVYMSVG